jgi:hypothetical protein
MPLIQRSDNQNFHRHPVEATKLLDSTQFVANLPEVRKIIQTYPKATDYSCLTAISEHSAFRFSASHSESKFEILVLRKHRAAFSNYLCRLMWMLDWYLATRPSRSNQHSFTCCFRQPQSPATHSSFAGCTILGPLEFAADPSRDRTWLNDLCRHPGQNPTSSSQQRRSSRRRK